MKLRYFITTGAALIAACSAPVSDTADPVPADTPQAYGAYMIVMGKDYAPQDLGPYAQALPPIYAKYGGKYVAFSTDVDVTEGSYNYQSLIISGWPDAKSARQFWDSPEYAEARKLRDGIGEFDVVIVPSLAAIRPKE